jgi:hypothetical protein
VAAVLAATALLVAGPTRVSFDDGVRTVLNADNLLVRGVIG